MIMYLSQYVTDIPRCRLLRLCTRLVVTFPAHEWSAWYLLPIVTMYLPWGPATTPNGIDVEKCFELFKKRSLFYAPIISCIGSSRLSSTLSVITISGCRYQGRHVQHAEHISDNTCSQQYQMEEPATFNHTGAKSCDLTSATACLECPPLETAVETRHAAIPGASCMCLAQSLGNHQTVQGCIP